MVYNHKMKKISLFAFSHELLISQSIAEKIQGLNTLYCAWLQDNIIFDNDYPVTTTVESGLPANLKLVAPKHLRRRRLYSEQGRAAMIHAILHIEFNAVNLALDAVYRFRAMPLAYYGDWLRVAREEGYHFQLLQQHLQSLGFDYGAFPAHLGLWEMAQKTAYDVLARMALVPRLLEARGLDVTPTVAKRLCEAKDSVAAEILAIIFHDEIGHVAVGNRWYHYLCAERQLPSLPTFLDLLKQHAPDYVRGPLFLEGRRQAGFQEDELTLLNSIIDKTIKIEEAS